MLAEGRGWLMTHGLVVSDPAQSSPDAYRITRLGRETVVHGIAKLTAAERLGIALHRRIAERVEQQFLLGEYELAVFAAVRDPGTRTGWCAGLTARRSVDAAGFCAEVDGATGRHQCRGWRAGGRDEPV